MYTCQTPLNYTHYICVYIHMGFPGGTSGKEPNYQCNPLQYSCLENPMDRGAWWATVHIVTESDTTEATPHTHTHTHTRAILTGAVLICIYLVISDFEHLFMYQRRYTNHFHHLLAVQISFL